MAFYMGRKIRNRPFLLILCIIAVILSLEFLLFLDTSEHTDTPISFHDDTPMLSISHPVPVPIPIQNKLDIDTMDMSKLSYCKYQNDNYNSHKFTTKELQDLMIQRSTLPTQICNKHEVDQRVKPHWKRLDITQFPNNMVNFVNRCKVNILTENKEFTEVWINNETGYNHVYKCGGTTIWNALDGMQNAGLMNGIGIKYHLDSFILHDNDYYSDHRSYFYNYLYNTFFFSYIRDPVDRFLSAYYELAVRETLSIRIQGNVSVHDKLRGLYHKLLNRKCDRLDAVSLEKRKKTRVNDVWSVDPHIHPQMIHLLNSTFEWLPYDYVGDLSDFDVTFRMLMDEFSDAVHDNESVYDDWVKRARNRESGDYGKESVNDVLKKKDLSDDDFKSICEIYWIDYLCLPFDVPPQCNLTDLFVRHYGDDLIYLDCYYL